MGIIYDWDRAHRPTTHEAAGALTILLVLVGALIAVVALVADSHTQTTEWRTVDVEGVQCIARGDDLVHCDW